MAAVHSENTDIPKTRTKSNSTTVSPVVANSTNRNSAIAANPRLKFRKSHTCGSLFANCSCSPTTPTDQRRTLLQSYSHPDTSFVFTSENKISPTDINGRNKKNCFATKDGKIIFSYPKRLSTPNIGNYSVVDVHPEIRLKISKGGAVVNRHRSNEDLETTHATIVNRRTISESVTSEFTHHEEGAFSVSPTLSASPPFAASPPAESNIPPLDESKLNEYDIDFKISSANNLEYLRNTAIGYQQETCKTDSAAKFFLESGILGPMMGNGTSMGRKSSKIQDVTNVIEQVRKASKASAKTLENRVATASAIVETVTASDDNKPALTINFQEEINILKDVIKSRDDEIKNLRREIDKLKSVLQKTVGPVRSSGDLLSSLQTNYCMPGQPHTKKHTATIPTDSSSNSNDTKSLLVPPAAIKKQGVSAESCDVSGQRSVDIKIPKYEKDFKSKQLIKDAIMDNDFLKNIDSSQVRELVDSMYSREVAMGEYVIREGDAGAHLYVSVEGEFEVIKNGKQLGIMGAGKAFGELAILYNCTRTASIRVLQSARIWVLDRRVFQQIMMRTGMQRIEENVSFLRSVPLLKNLSNDILTKVADVLEVEFYPAGAYIIRQGANGDTFYLISQGNVKVTQKLPERSEEEEIRTLGRGDYFGEQALIKEDKRTANIITLSPGVECLTLNRASFTQLIGDLSELHEKDYGDQQRMFQCRRGDICIPTLERKINEEFINIRHRDLIPVTTLGLGGFGRVELVKYVKGCGKPRAFALKCLKKEHIVATRQEDHVFSERSIMLSCDTPFICRLYKTFRDNKFVYMLLEACLGGEIWTILRDRGNFDDYTTQFTIGCVLQAFDYLHARGIVYRDLKPENLMLDERGYVKLVDFGFAKYIGYSSKTWTFCGTPEYVAPEIILNKGHDRAVDYWALGVLIHELLTGAPPFTASDPMKTYNIILKGIDMVDFPRHMPRSAVSLIKRLCRDIPVERLGYQKGGIQDIKKHKWFEGFDWDGLAALTLTPPIQHPIKNFLDTTYFDTFPLDHEVPPDETSGWDVDF